jgi:membrane fusion protein (multidrug efflux system)
MNIERPISSQGAQTGALGRTGLDPAVLRRIALIGVPALVIILGTLLYVSGGRFVDTDDAYVKSDMAAISPDVSGTISEIYVTENQAVTKGQKLLKVNSSVYTLGVAGATVNLEVARKNVESDKAAYRQKVEALAMADTDVMFADRELKRQSSLAKSQNVSIQRLDEAKHAYQTAQQRISLLKQEEAEYLAKLEGKPDQPVEEYAAYKAAQVQLASAQYFLDHTAVLAPFDGIVSKVPKVGDYSRTGVPLMSIVAPTKTWIDANFKETDLTHMQPGQPVTFTVDTYPGYKFHGHVDSVAQASGAEFALLPAQNTTGNWIKVVQRITVRIAIDEVPAEGHVLRSGMSVIASVDTGHRRISRWLGMD